MTAHWITDSFTSKQCVLHCSHFPGNHSSINIAANFKTLLSNWNISEEQVHIVVRDNAYNMQLGMELLEMDNMPCFIHVLQLIIKDSLFSQRAIKDMLANCRKMCGHFNHSSLACSALKQIQKELDPSLATALLPVQDVPTRWNSTYLMLKRMEILKRSLQLYTANQNGIVALTTNEWNLLKKVIIILQPFYIVTTNISKSKSIISSVIPHVCALHSYLSSSAETDRGVQTLKNELKSSLEKRLLCNNYSSGEAMHVFEHKLLATSTAVDPRYKVTVFSNQKDKAKKWLVEEVRNELNFLKAANSHPVEPLTASGTGSPSASELPTTSGTHSASESVRQNRNSLSEVAGSSSTGGHFEIAVNFLSFYTVQDDGSTVSTTQEGPTNEELKTEINSYVSQPTINHLANENEVLAWCNCNKERFPNISILAKKLLATPASSVYSERLFSEAGNVFEKKRSRLLPSTGEKFIFLHHNLHKF